MRKSLIAAAVLAMLTASANSAEDGGGAGGGQAIADRHGGQKDTAWTPGGRVHVWQKNKAAQKEKKGQPGNGGDGTKGSGHEK